MEIIESIQNQKIKQIAKLHNRKDRKKMQQFIIEGEHLVEEAVNSNIDIEMILKKLPKAFGNIRNIPNEIFFNQQIQELSKSFRLKDVVNNLVFISGFQKRIF